MKTVIHLVCAFVLLSGVGWAHGDQVHVMGTVSKIETDTITVATTAGGEKTVKLVAATKFLKGESPATPKDLKVGDRVVIHAKPNGPVLEATEVKIGIAQTVEHPK
jgi:preprotein translocase subunit YajC